MTESKREAQNATLGRKPGLQRLSPFLILAFGLLWLTSCTSKLTPTPHIMPHTPAGPTSTPLPGTPTSTVTPLPPTQTPTPSKTPVPRPTVKGEKDAFAVTYFPWADRLAEPFPRDPDSAKAKVVNSIFLDDPPFFGFDIQTGGLWYHIVGIDHWAVTDAQRISPTICGYRRPGDGDTVIIYGEIHKQLVTASYIGFADGTPYYYRSLLQAEELRSGKVPAVYDGLDVWVRDILDTTERWRQLYVLPEGLGIDPNYAGQEALVGGRLLTKGGIRVQVDKGIYIRSDDRYVKILEHMPSEPQYTYEQGTIHAVERSGRLVSMQTADGRLVEVHTSETTAIEFADRSLAGPSELSPGRYIQAIGSTSASDHLWATRVTIVRTAASGRTYAAYIAGVNGDLWSISLDESDRHQITHLTAPALGLADAEFSPDGLHFVFAQQHGSQVTLMLGNLQSGEMRGLLTDDKWQETDPAWSPEGSRIIFCRHRMEGEQRIDGGLWLLNLSNSAVKRLSAPAGDGRLTVSPQWSPDGKYIAFGQAIPAGERLSRLYVLSLPEDSRMIIEHVFEWRWSVDSTYLLCTRQAPDEQRTRLWVVLRDGSSPTWLSPMGVADRHGRFSPDGTAIAFLSRPQGSGGRDYLWQMNADGTRRRQPEGQPLANWVAWSADSQAIVFVRVTPDGKDHGPCIVGRDGSGLHELAADATGLVGTYRAP